MGALFIDRRDARLSLDADCIRIEAGDERLSLPLRQVDRVIIRGAARVDTGLLSRLWSLGVGVLLLSGRRSEPTARFHGQPHNDVRRRMTQTLAACEPRQAVEIARAVVRAKLLAQAHTLDRLAGRRPAVRRDAIQLRRTLGSVLPAVETADSINTLRGHEGGVARLYWQGLTGAFAPSLGFSGRNRRPPRDPVNAVLSLAYTVATFEAGRQSQRCGLDPMIGYLHAPAFGRESLACDLVEPLRPRIDAWTEKLFRERTVRREHFSFAEQGACLLGKAGREAFYRSLDDALPVWERWLGRAVRHLAAALDGQPLPEFPPGPEDDG